MMKKDVVKRATVAGLIMQGYSDEDIHSSTNAGWDMINEIRSNLPDELWQQNHEWIPPEDIENCNIQQLIQRNLELGIKAQINISKLTYDNEWLKKQTAADIATLYSDLSDKSVRLLAAQQRAAERRQLLPSGGTPLNGSPDIEMEAEEHGSDTGLGGEESQTQETSSVSSNGEAAWTEEIHSPS